jgi:hypothetical protein
MTVVRLSGGDLLLHSPTRCNAETTDALSRIGRVTDIVAPNKFHDLFLDAWLAAVPEARLWIPSGTDGKFPRGSRTRLLSDCKDATWREELACVPLKGMSRLEESAFYHRPSKSVIVADLLFNIQTDARLAMRMAARLGGFYRRLAMPRDIRWWYVSSRDALKESIRTIMNFQFENVVVGHGANVLRNGKAKFEMAFQWLFAEDRASSERTENR